MATNTREEHRSPRAAMASSEADAKMVVATSRGDCQKLKDLVHEQDATTMLVVMSSSKPAPHKPSPVTKHPLLAAAACRGNWKELNFLLNREGPQEQPGEDFSKEFRNQVAAYPSGDLEQGTREAWLRKGVTVEGDTALHLVTANGEGEDFLKCADLIIHALLSKEDNTALHSVEANEDDSNFVECANLTQGKDDKAGLLLSLKNNNDDTPLHCAARAGKAKMVSHLIGLAGDKRSVEELLRKENKSKETALHEAVRIGDNGLVIVLLEADPELACFPQEGSSALYLAILQDEESIAQILYYKSKGMLSYSGPEGQNALHVAVMRSTAMVGMLLDRNNNKLTSHGDCNGDRNNNKLTSDGDCNGSTPLHFLSSQARPNVLCAKAAGRLLEENLATLYQPDNCGLYPIHIAASVGNKMLVDKFIRSCQSSAGLRDSRGRTFLHVAAKNLRWHIVAFACGTQSLAWILNMQDNKGNTALHLAVRARSLRMVCFLLWNRQVNINITNKKGQTPLDIAECKIPSGMYYVQVSEIRVRKALKISGGKNGGRRWDHFEQKYIQRKGNDYDKQELEKVKESTQTLCIGSVLIATMAFGATFALPGGYKADDHIHGGTPTLAGRYAFDAFIMASTLAFICSLIATVGFMFSGNSFVDLKSRKFYYLTALYFLVNSVKSLTAAFALGVYIVLAQVAHRTAVAIVVMSHLLIIYATMEYLLKSALISRSVSSRIGLIATIIMSSATILVNVLCDCWPVVVIFGWAAIARNH